MRLGFLAAFIVLPSLAWADDYTISLSTQDLSYIGGLLGKQPYNEVSALLVKLQAQIDKANAAKAGPPTPAEVKKDVPDVKK
jgi:hypothetical protein